MAAPHTVLGIRPDASQDEIRAAWRALVRRSHPDLAGNAVSAEDRMKAINAAHDAMLDALVRAKQAAAEARRTEARQKMPGRRGGSWLDASGSVSGGRRCASGQARSAPAQTYPSQPCPPPERPFEAPRRIVPGAASVMRMRAALAGRLRRYLDRESARQGGAAYSVPGRAGWRDDDAVLSYGGLPATHLATRIDVRGRRVILTLDARPGPGTILVALPRLVRDGAGGIRCGAGTTVIEVDITEQQSDMILLSDAHASCCIPGSRDTSVEIRFPLTG